MTQKPQEQLTLLNIKLFPVQCHREKTWLYKSLKDLNIFNFVSFEK